MITNSSNWNGYRINIHALQLFPQDLFFPWLDDTREAIENFARQYLRASSRGIGASEPETLASGREVRLTDYDMRPSNSPEPTILICGHMSRDSRCGILGPILKEEFQRQIGKRLQKMWQRVCPDTSEGEEVASHYSNLFKSLSLCSHVGGHAFAGNVIINFPANCKLAKDGTVSPLAGKSVWYGRVEPDHVGGIVDETIIGGKVIEDLLRGVNSFPDTKPVKCVTEQET